MKIFKISVCFFTFTFSPNSKQILATNNNENYLIDISSNTDFKNLYDAFSTHGVKKDEHVGAIGSSVINELFLDTISDFEQHHDGEQPERIDRIFDGEFDE